MNVIAEHKVVDIAFIDRFMTGDTRLMIDLVANVKAVERVSGLPQEERRRGQIRSKAPPNLGIPCPICRKGRITENERAFGCSRWKQGCVFTLRKDALVRFGGLKLNRKIVETLLRDGQVKGSTGMIVLSEKTLAFQVMSSTDVSPAISLEYKNEGEHKSGKSVTRILLQSIITAQPRLCGSLYNYIIRYLPY